MTNKFVCPSSFVVVGSESVTRDKNQDPGSWQSFDIGIYGDMHGTVLRIRMPDDYKGGEDGGEKLVEQVDRCVGKQQAQLIHNLVSHESR